MTDLAKLVVKLEAETARYQSELEKAKRQLGSFEQAASGAVGKIGRAAGAAAAAAAVGFSAMVASSIAAADNLNDLSQITGETAEELSALASAAELSGTDLEGLTTGFRGLSKIATEAAKGSKAASEAFEAIGVSATDSEDKVRGTRELLLDIAEQFSQYEDGAAKAALAQQLFGRAGAELIPFLNKGRVGIEELTQRARELGLTISSETAAAADEFNDNLTRLQQVGRGLANQVAEELLPTLVSLTDDLAGSAESGQKFADVATVIATGLKLLISSGRVVGEVFDRIGSAIGGAAASLVAVAQGEFRRAFEIIRESQSDTIDSVREAADQVAGYWAESGAKVVATAAAADQQLKKSLVFGGQGSAVQEVEISAQRLDLSPIQAYYAELDELTKTSSEKQLSAYRLQREALTALYDDGILKAEQYNARVESAIDELLPQIEISAKRMTEVVEQQTNELTEFQKQAARNTQDIIADTLTSGFDEGLDGLAKRFGQMLLELSAQAVAADIAGKIFSNGAGGGGAGFFSAIAGLFAPSGGTMDAGGRGQAGMAYAIGTGAQPELFVPDSAGTFIPRGGIGRKVEVTNHFNFPQGSTVSRQTQMQVAAAAGRAVSQALQRS